MQQNFKDLYHPITKEPDSIQNDNLFLLLICLSKMRYPTNYSNPQLTQTPSSKKAIKWFEQYGETELWESMFTQSITLQLPPQQRYISLHFLWSEERSSVWCSFSFPFSRLRSFPLWFPSRNWIFRLSWHSSDLKVQIKNYKIIIIIWQNSEV